MILIDLFDNIRGILKRRKVVSMLCAEYSYKTDIAVKKEEAFKEGMEAGISQGAQQKAVEAAIKIIHKYKANPEDAAKDMDAPLELVLEALKQDK